MRRLSVFLCLCTSLCLMACDDDPQPNNNNQKDMAQDQPSDLSADLVDMPKDESSDLDMKTDMGPQILDPNVFNTPEEAFNAVNPFIGSGGVGYGYAALTPAAQAPVGLVKLGPDTTNGGAHPDITHFSGYYYTDPHIRGFSHTHFVGTGVADYGNLRVVVGEDPSKMIRSGYYVSYDSASQVAQPGYYQVNISEPNTKVALTALGHSGAHQYTFEKAGRVYLGFDVASSVTDGGVEEARIEVDGQKFTGWVRYKGPYVGRRRAFDLHFSGTISVAPQQTQLWDETGLLDASVANAQSPKAGATWGFDVQAGQTIELRIGVSVVDAQQAEAHRQSQVPESTTFEEVRGAVKALWLEKLRRVKVAGGTKEEREKFFTAFYNAYRMPSRWSGEDGRYFGLDGQVHTAQGFHYYTDLSLWDTFRTLHPWYTLVDNEVQRDALKSLLAMHDVGGAVPRWPAGPSFTGGMIGTSADILFGESAKKGIEGIDWNEALTALLKTADGKPDSELFSGRNGIDAYLQYGYLPDDVDDESVSRSLEFYYNDWALSNLAEVAQNNEVAQRMAARAKKYTLLFDTETKFFRPKNSAGVFNEDFNPLEFGDRGDGPFTEGTAWHWRLYVPHDAPGLATLMGGPQALEAALEEYFTKSRIGSPRPFRNLLPDRYYWHSNEPALHNVYVYHAAQNPKRMGYWIDQIRTRLYTTGPEGIPGNDDGGTLSSWYLFSAIGIFPIAGGDDYWWGVPQFTKVEVEMAPNTKLTIEAPEARPGKFSVKSVSLDGQPVNGSTIKHGQLKGGTLRFEFD